MVLRRSRMDGTGPPLGGRSRRHGQRRNGRAGSDRPWSVAFWSALRTQSTMLPLLLLLAAGFAHALARIHTQVFREMRRALVQLPLRRVILETPGRWSATSGSSSRPTTAAPRRSRRRPGSTRRWTISTAAPGRRRSRERYGPGADARARHHGRQQCRPDSIDTGCTGTGACLQ